MINGLAISTISEARAVTFSLVRDMESMHGSITVSLHRHASRFESCPALLIRVLRIKK